MYLFIYDYVIIKNKKKEFQYKLQIIICYAKKKKIKLSAIKKFAASFILKQFMLNMINKSSE